MNKLNHQFGHRNIDRYFIDENDIIQCTLSHMAPNREEELFIEFELAVCIHLKANKRLYYTE